tara:strand:- start:699 stop:890 length:192 start_codon:yes stop_codon:yes gene_type:complete
MRSNSPTILWYERAPRRKRLMHTPTMDEKVIASPPSLDVPDTNPCLIIGSLPKSNRENIVRSI